MNYSFKVKLDASDRKIRARRITTKSVERKNDPHTVCSLNEPWGLASIDKIGPKLFIKRSNIIYYY